MLGNFNIPSVDHLREGIDYKVLDWDFAAGQPVSTIPHTPGQPCPPNFKMVFGICRRLKQGTDEWDPKDESDFEKVGKAKAQQEGSKFENNKPVDIGGKKYGWAKKNGVPVLVEWGSVAGTKPKAPSAAPAATPQATPTSGQVTPSNVPLTFT